MDKNCKRKRTSQYSSRHLRRKIQNDVDSDLEYSNRPLREESWSESLDDDVLSADDTNMSGDISLMNDEAIAAEITQDRLEDINHDNEISEHANENSDNSNYDAPDRNDRNIDHILPVAAAEEYTSGSEESIVSAAESLASVANVEQILVDLTSWSLRFNIQHNALSALLLILREHTDLPNLPKDSRTLLSTPRQTKVAAIAGGEYCHFGLKRVLGIIAKQYANLDNPAQSIKLLVNIDGAPLSNSSKSSIWPILCSDTILKQVFVIGAFCGEEKPKNANEFLKPFVDEAIEVVSNGFLYNERVMIVRISGLVCDAPAKAFVLGVKHHTGYNSCTKCVTRGEYLCRRLCYPEGHITSALRTDREFRNNEYEDFQLGDTILKNVPNFNLIRNVPLDYMHLLCLGVTKKIISLWLKGPLSFRLSARMIQEISERLKALRCDVPIEFVRKPRSLSDYKYWKATEFRQFLLYTGPIVLKGILREDMYLNFLTLHIATTIIASPNLAMHGENLDYAQNLFEHFVTSFGLIYGKHYMSHNIHNLLHICEDVKKFGPVDVFSAFRFENYISSILKKIRKPEKPLQQLARRYAELELLNAPPKQTILQSALKKCHNDGPLINRLNVINQYKILSTSSFSIRCDNVGNDCCALEDGSVVKVLNIVEHSDRAIVIVGKKLISIDDVYTSPCESGKLSIQVVREGKRLHSWTLESIKLKMFRMSYGQNFVVFPLIHI